MFYQYRRRSGAITTGLYTQIQHMAHFAVVLRSLYSFASGELDKQSFDPLIAKCWAQYFFQCIIRHWFTQEAIQNIPRIERRNTLKKLFSNGMEDFWHLVKVDAWQRQVAARVISLFVQYPCFGWCADFFFKNYETLHKMKDKLFPRK